MQWHIERYGMKRVEQAFAEVQKGEQISKLAEILFYILLN
jgi:hypothetical protein